MTQRRLSLLPIFITSTFFIASLLLLSLSPVAAQPYNATPAPLQDSFELSDLQYAYNPETQILTKTYTFKNISGETIFNPLLVNLFLWSNNNSSVNWPAMGYNGTSTYANSEQSAATANPSGLLDWSASVNPATIDSTQLFPLLPQQTVQSGAGYPYWSIPGYELQWPNDASATIELRFSNVLNSNWIQNMVWIVSALGADTDKDGIPDDADNCPLNCNIEQLDHDGDGIGDVCDGPGTAGKGCSDGCGSPYCEQECIIDTDNDTIPDVDDNCPTVCNSAQLDADSDGIGDVCDDTPGCGGGCGAPACEQGC